MTRITRRTTSRRCASLASRLASARPPRQDCDGDQQQCSRSLGLGIATLTTHRLTHRPFAVLPALEAGAATKVDFVLGEKFGQHFSKWKTVESNKKRNRLRRKTFDGGREKSRTSDLYSGNFVCRLSMNVEWCLRRSICRAIA